MTAQLYNFILAIMHRIERSVLVTYSAEQMFSLVAAVKDYPVFLPWCAGAHVRPHRDGSIEARIDIHYRGVRSSFTTRNHNQPPNAIRRELLDGPFRRLTGGWEFRALQDDACKVRLQLQYEFAPGLLGRAIAPVFEGIAASLVDSFTVRADALYDGR